MAVKDIKILSASRKICRISVLTAVSFSVSLSASSDFCEKSFITGTRYEAMIIASRVDYKDFHSDYLNFKRDQELELKWNLQNTGVPSLLQALVPEGVFPINHREEFSPRPYLIRLQEWGAAIAARAHYLHKGIRVSTNVLFGINSIRDRIKNYNKKWLVSPNAKAAVFYLHGGGRVPQAVHLSPLP